VAVIVSYVLNTVVEMLKPNRLWVKFPGHSQLWNYWLHCCCYFRRFWVTL